jgi:hypothetical protein
MRLGQDFPVISHNFPMCFTTRSVVVPLPALGPWVPRGDAEAQAALGPQHGGACGHQPLSVGGYGATDGRGARKNKNHREGGLILAYGSVKKNQHSMGKRKKMMDICIYIYICDIWVCLEIE